MDLHFVVAALGRDCDEFTLHIYASLAEQEWEMISERIKAANAAAKRNGQKFGLRLRSKGGRRRFVALGVAAWKASRPPADPQVRGVYTTTAPELNRDYEATEVATDQKIGGRVVVVSGSIDSIDKDFLDHAVIHLRTGNQFIRPYLETI